MKTKYYDRLDTPIGTLSLVWGDKGLSLVSFKKQIPKTAGELTKAEKNNPYRAAFEGYFRGRKNAFQGLELDPAGSPFQLRVWELLLKIPHGQTRSYGDLAKDLGRPNAARAVGWANGTNPLCIVVPCHRVIGKDGSLTGYAGGLKRKAWLLDHEGAQCQLSFVA